MCSRLYGVSFLSNDLVSPRETVFVGRAVRLDDISLTGTKTDAFIGFAIELADWLNGACLLIEIGDLAQTVPWSPPVRFLEPFWNRGIEGQGRAPLARHSLIAVGEFLARLYVSYSIEYLLKILL